jgi:hypothetical protein
LVNLSAIIYRKGNFNGDLILKLTRGEIFQADLTQYDTNVSEVNLGEVQFPYVISLPSFKNLLKNKPYKLISFIDSNQNGVFDGSELYAEWSGVLNRNRSDIKAYT